MNTEEKILAILEKHSEMFAQMQADISGIKENIDRLNLRMDLDVGKRLDALSEGQDVIEKRLDTLGNSMGEVKKLAETTADKVDVIHAVVTQHSAAITELKKVQ